MALIAVDMTPVLPGGDNGGAKLVAIELLKGFQTMATGDRFLILTATWNDNELAYLDSSNTQRLCVTAEKSSKTPINLHFPSRIERGLRKIYRLLRRHYTEILNHNGLLSSRGVDVLFCPFTSPAHAEQGIPVVSLIHDLQHKDYPQFFTPKEIDIRESFYKDVSKRADAVICISEFVRQSVIKYLKINPEKIYTIYNCIQSRLGSSDPSDIVKCLRLLGIDRHPYMFYPANFWPHKNHLMLLTSYGMYLSRNPDFALDLVFTGALDSAQQNLKDKVRRMGLEQRVHFLGYLPEDQLIAVWKGCYFLVFPSLYEGFGIPVLEAMLFGKPALCSDVTSLPEVGGNAVLYFDPRKPGDIVQCIEKITASKELYADLVERGYERLSHFQFQEMLNKYLRCFKDVVTGSRLFHNSLKQ